MPTYLGATAPGLQGAAVGSDGGSWRLLSWRDCLPGAHSPRVSAPILGQKEDKTNARRETVPAENQNFFARPGNKSGTRVVNGVKVE
jgi:hypothetical protein